MKFGYSKDRPVLLLAPDAVLTLNQNVRLPICKQCGASSNIVDLVTRISVSASVDNSPGSATFDLTIPKHSSSQVYEQGKLSIPLLSEVEIFMKGRFLDNTGNPQYYRVFWGLVMSTEYTYSDGSYTIHVSCDDMLRWWDISKVITQDSLLNSVYNTRQPFRALSNVYSYLKPNEIIYALSVAMFEDNISILEANLGNPDLVSNVYVTESFVYESALQYWKARFATLSEPGNLSIFGNNDIDPKRKKAIYNAIRGVAQAEVLYNAAASGTAVEKDLASLDSTKTSIQDATFLDTAVLFNEYSGGFDSTQLGTKSPLEVAKEVADRINFEFFMDTGGTITFKPALYNMPTKNDKAYRISDLDLISYTIRHNFENIYTRIDLNGSFTMDQGLQNKPSTFYIDPQKSKQYGIKLIQKDLNYIKNVDTLRIAAVYELNRLNTKEYTGTITIAGRPEIRLGTPIFLECENLYAYVTDITHEFDFGQSFTTTLTISAIRRSGKRADGTNPPSYILIKNTKTTATKATEAQKGLEDYLKRSNNTAITSETELGLFKKVFGENADPLNVAGNKANFEASLKTKIAEEPKNKQAYETLQTKLIKMNNFITAATTTFEIQPVSDNTKVQKKTGEGLFQVYDSDAYELVFGVSYGLTYFTQKGYLKDYPLKPVEILASANTKSALSAASVKSSQCKCTT